MAKRNTSPDAAREGFWSKPGDANPYIWSSDSWAAWQVGAHMRDTRAGDPVEARKSRGNRTIVNGITFAVADDGTVSRANAMAA